MELPRSQPCHKFEAANDPYLQKQQFLTIISETHAESSLKKGGIQGGPKSGGVIIAIGIYSINKSLIIHKKKDKP